MGKGRKGGGGGGGGRGGVGGGGGSSDGDRRSGHLADGGVCGSRILRGDSGGDLGHSARRAIDGLTHAYFARRRALGRIFEPWRHQAHHAVSVLGERVLHDGAGCF